MEDAHRADVSLRHILATLAYRAAKVLREPPEDFTSWRPGDSSRSAGQILAHLCDLMDWALSISQGSEQWSSSRPGDWEGDTGRLFAALTALDEYLASGAQLHAPAERLFQSAIADAFTHIGQLAMMRRLAGKPVRGENYFVARIGAGNAGPDQPAAVQEFE